MEYGRSDVRWDAESVDVMWGPVILVWTSTLQLHLSYFNALPAGCLVYCLNDLRTSD